MKVIEDQYAASGVLDMGAIEEGLMAALMKDGCQRLERFFKEHVPVCAEDRKTGERHYKNRPIEVHCVLGKFQLCRDYFYDGDIGRAPFDELLGLRDGYTPGLQRLMARAGSMSPSFERAGEDLQVYARLNIPGRSIQRMTAAIGPEVQKWLIKRPPEIPKQPPAVLYVSYDATGVPMTKSETKGRKGKQPDGSAKTREVKLGCVFTQIRRKNGEAPERDPDSTTHVASFDESLDFGALIQQEARLRGMAYAKRVVVLGDGAAWIWEVARIYFPDAIQILDLYHAIEHLSDLAKLLCPSEKVAKRKVELWKKWLKKDKVDHLIRVTSSAASSLKNRDEVLKAIQYFQTNQNRMLYGSFKQHGYFVGSGVIEAGCKTVVGQRTKQSGMFWHVVGAQNVLSVRCAVLGRLYDNFWTYKHEQIKQCA